MCHFLLFLLFSLTLNICMLLWECVSLSSSFPFFLLLSSKQQMSANYTIAVLDELHLSLRSALLCSALLCLLSMGLQEKVSQAAKTPAVGVRRRRGRGGGC